MCYTVGYLERQIRKYELKTGLIWKFPGQIVSGFTHPLLPIETYEGHIFAHWGLIPAYTKTPQEARETAKHCLNARHDSFTKTIFSRLAKTKRCLVPVSGFIEYMHMGGEKYPHFIYSPGDNMMNLAGLWDTWLHEEKEINTFSIVTTEANELMAKIHNSKKRMPIVITDEFAEQWLTPGYSESIDNYALRPEAELIAHTIQRPQHSIHYEDRLKKHNYTDLARLL